VPGGLVRFVHTQNLTLAYWVFEAGARFPEHSHPHEQVVKVIEGEFEFWLDGAAERMGPGSVGIVPPHAAHWGRALTACRIMDVFYPPRDDYRF
jgi:quercetin dioxygenase-like cupin family protein